MSVYLVSQSVGAWMYRIMLIFIPTWLLWRYFIRPAMRSRRGDNAPAPAPPQPDLAADAQPAHEPTVRPTNPWLAGAERAQRPQPRW